MFRFWDLHQFSFPSALFRISFNMFPLLKYVKHDSITHSSLRKSKVLDFSVGNWEKVLLLFTKLPGVLYLTLDWDSTFFIAGALEEELNSLLKLQVAKLQKAKRETEQTGVQGKSKEWGHQPTGQPRSHHQHLLYSDVKHAGSS